MAINPISSAFTALDSLTAGSQPSSGAGSAAAAKSKSAATAALQQEIASLESTANNDPLLNPTTSSTTGSVLDSFSSMLGTGSSATGSTGDPLLDDLNALDASSLNSSPTSTTSQDSMLNQQLLSAFPLQQAAGSYTNGQTLGNTQLPGAGTAGGASA